MSMLGRVTYIITLLFLTAIESIAQNTIVFGKVKDAETGDRVHITYSSHWDEKKERMYLHQR